jgi:hypothetical protein
MFKKKTGGARLHLFAWTAETSSGDVCRSSTGMMNRLAAKLKSDFMHLLQE